MSQRLPTPSQTVGPFFHDCMLREGARCDTIVDAGGRSPAIRVRGRVLDGNGLGVPDAVVEIWQASPAGQYGDAAVISGFTGFARVGTDDSGAFSFTTVTPGRVPFDDTSLQAPHLDVAVFARGLLNHLFTRIYFEDQPENVSDPVLGLVPAQRRSTLIARVEGTASDAGLTRSYRFDIVLQGADETVFFDFVRGR